MRTAPHEAAPLRSISARPQRAGRKGGQFTNEIGPTLMKVGYDGGVLFVRLT